MTEPYMNGRGLTRRTEELNDRAWGALPFAFVGWVVVLLGVMALVGMIMNDPPISSSRFMDWVLSSLGFCAGAAMICPWACAINAVREHGSRMRAETKKRGEGWARS